MKKRKGREEDHLDDQGQHGQMVDDINESRNHDSRLHAVSQRVESRGSQEHIGIDEEDDLSEGADKDDDDDEDEQEEGDEEDDEEEEEEEEARESQVEGEKAGRSTTTSQGSLATSKRSDSSFLHDSTKKVSCQPCRVAKVRCQPAPSTTTTSSSDPAGPCVRCAKLSKECVYRVHKRGRKPGKIKFQQILRRLEILDRTLKEIENLNQDVGDVDADSLVKTLSWQLRRSKFFSNNHNLSINNGSNNGGARRTTSQNGPQDVLAKRERVKMEQSHDFYDTGFGVAEESSVHSQHQSLDHLAGHPNGRQYATQQQSSIAYQSADGRISQVGDRLRRDISHATQSHLGGRGRQSERGLLYPPSFVSTSASSSTSTTRSGSVLQQHHHSQRQPHRSSAGRISTNAETGAAHDEDGVGGGFAHRDDPSSRTDYNMLVDMEDQASVNRVPDEFPTLSNPLKLLAQASTEERNRRRLQQQQQRFDSLSDPARRSRTGSTGNSVSLERESRRNHDNRSTSRSERNNEQDRDVEDSRNRRKRMRSSSLTPVEEGRRDDDEGQDGYDRETSNRRASVSVENPNRIADTHKRQRASSTSSNDSLSRDGPDKRQHRVSSAEARDNTHNTKDGTLRQSNTHSETNDPGLSSATSSSWATTYFSRGAFHPVYDNRQEFDPIDCGLMTFQQATRLISSFYQNFGNFIHIFDPHLSTITYIRKHSAFLLTVLCSISAEFESSNDVVLRQESSDLAVSLKRHYEVLMQHITKNGEYKNVEMAQAFFLLAQYKELSENAQRDQTWFFLSTAIRIATELGCNLCCYSYSTPQSRDAVVGSSTSPSAKGSVASTTGSGSSSDKTPASLAALDGAQGTTAAKGAADGTIQEHYQRQLRNTERLWINLYNFEKTLASMTGQRFHLSDHEGVIATCSNWHTMQYSLAQDEVLIAQTELRRLLARKSDWFSVNIVRCLENKFSMTTTSKNKSSRKRGNDIGVVDDDEAFTNSPQRLAQQEQLSLQLNYFRTSVDTDLRRWEEKWLSTPLSTSSSSSMSSYTATPASTISTSTPSTTTTTTTTSSSSGGATPTPLQIIAYLTLHYSALITYALPLPIKYTVDVGEELTNLYRNCYISATNYMVCFIERSSQSLMDYITNSLVVSTVYCVVFSLDLVRRKNLQDRDKVRGANRSNGSSKRVGGWVDFGFVSSKRVLSLARLTAQELKKIGNAKLGRQGKSVGGRFAEFLETVLERVDADADAGACDMGDKDDDDEDIDVHDDAHVQGRDDWSRRTSDVGSSTRNGKARATHRDNNLDSVGEPNEAYSHANQNSHQPPHGTFRDGQIAGPEARIPTAAGITGTTASQRHSSHAHFSSQPHAAAAATHRQQHHLAHHQQNPSNLFSVQQSHFLHPLHNNSSFSRHQQPQQGASALGSTSNDSTSNNPSLGSTHSHDGLIASQHPTTSVGVNNEGVVPNDAHWFSTPSALPNRSNHAEHHTGRDENGNTISNDPTATGLDTAETDLVLDDKQWEWMMKDLSFFNHVDGGDPILDQLGRLFG